MFERFTDRARKVMALANQQAQRLNREYVDVEHLLLGLAVEGSGVGATVLKNIGVDLRELQLKVDAVAPKGPEVVTMGKLPQTPKVKRALEASVNEARTLKHNYVGTEHILLGLLSGSDGIAVQILTEMGVDTEKVRKHTLELLGSDGNTDAPVALKEYTDSQLLLELLRRQM